MGIKIPADLTKLSLAELETLAAGVQTEFDAALSDPNPSMATVEEAERLSAGRTEIAAAVEAKTAEQAAVAARLEALRTPEEPVVAAAEVVEVAPEPEIVAQTASAESTATEGTAVIIPDAVFGADGAEILAEDLRQSPSESDAEFRGRQARFRTRAQAEAAPVAAAAVVAGGSTLVMENIQTTGFIRQVAGQRPVVPADHRAQGEVAIIASADVPGYGAGARLKDMVDVGQALLNRMDGFPSFSGEEGVRAANPEADLMQFGVVTFKKPFSEDLILKEGQDATELFAHAASEARLPGKSLVAAGGWCAPSEVLYDLCAQETTDGMLSIPEVQIRRGGLKYTMGPDFGTIYDNTGFCQTETQAINGTTKPCYELTCPSWTDVRMDACGVCIKVPILTEVGFPELVARIVSGSLIAHQHHINAKVINAIQTALGSAVVATDMGSTAQTTLNSIELIIEGIRSRYRMGFNQTMEVVAPHWLLGAIRADLSYRMGLNELAVTDQMINAYFAARKANVQWVEDWQPVGGGSTLSNTNACPIVYPDTVDLLVYPSGAFVKGTSDVIKLNAVYDAASLSVNTYTGLFFEEGILVARTCFGGCRVTVAICNSGQVGPFAAEPVCGIDA